MSTTALVIWIVLALIGGILVAVGTTAILVHRHQQPDDQEFAARMAVARAQWPTLADSPTAELVPVPGDQETPAPGPGSDGDEDPTPEPTQELRLRVPALPARTAAVPSQGGFGQGDTVVFSRVTDTVEMEVAPVAARHARLDPIGRPLPLWLAFNTGGWSKYWDSLPTSPRPDPGEGEEPGTGDVLVGAR